MKLKKVLSLALAGVMTLGLVACGGAGDTTKKETDKAKTKKAEKVEDVNLNVWGSEDEQVIIQGMVDEFIKVNKDKVNLTVKVSTQSEEDSATIVMEDIENAADIFSIPNDQLASLVKSGALAEISKEDFADVLTRNTQASVQSSIYKDKLYGFPRTADNGYFLYYNTKYFTEADVQTWETLLAKAAAAGKKVGMELNSGWYGFGFFRAAGLSTSVDEKGNTICDYNSKTNKYKGIDVAQAMLNIGKHKGFICVENDPLCSGIANGAIVAGISGTWNASKIEKAWGANYAATKLPTFKCAGDDLQMYSVAGSKIFCVNAKSKNTEWAAKLADWLTNEENQIKFCEEKGIGPSNLNAAKSDAVKDNKALAAVSMQQQWSEVQYVGNNYWEPTKTFGQTLADGNKNGTNLQVLLDNMVKNIIKPIE